MSYNPSSVLPWQEVLDQIHKKYQVLDQLDLSIYYDDWHSLYFRLKKSAKNYYESNEKFIFFYFESGFCHNNTDFFIFNLQKILTNLSIPQFACILFSANYGITDTIRKTAKDICNDTTNMNIIEMSYVQQLANPVPPKLDDPQIEKITNPFICLNRKMRSHRIMFLSLLKEMEVLDKGIFSWHGLTTGQHSQKRMYGVSESTELAPITFLTSDPPSTFNDHIDWSEKIHKVYQKNSNFFTGQTYLPETISEFNSCTCTIEEHFLSSFLVVITETVYDYPYQFITEKTFKAILNKRPFLILGSKDTLKKVKSLGFKTFSEFIDESYDDISDPTDRMFAVANIVKEISKLRKDQLHELYQKMIPILEYNNDHYRNYFCSDGLLEIIGKI